jgi:hypothetical protein
MTFNIKFSFFNFVRMGVIQMTFGMLTFCFVQIATLFCVSFSLFNLYIFFLVLHVFLGLWCSFILTINMVSIGVLNTWGKKIHLNVNDLNWIIVITLTCLGN